MRRDRAPEIQSRFGRIVQKQRLELGISQEKLGERAGLDRSYVGHVEQGRRNASLIAIVQLAEGLGIPAWKLFYDYDDTQA